MNDLDQNLRDLPNEDITPDAAAKAAARARLVQSVAGKQTASHVKPIRKRMWISGAVAGTAAAAVIATLLVTSSDSNTPHVATPTTANPGATYVASSELGKVFMQAASAQKPEEMVTSTWYYRAHHEAFWDPNTLGNDPSTPKNLEKYGTPITQPRMETYEEWRSANTKRKTISFGDTSESNGEGYSWNSTMKLPNDPASIRRAYENDVAKNYNTADPNESAETRSRNINISAGFQLLNDLSVAPMTVDVRRSALVVVAQIADNGFLVDKGIVKDTLGRTGHAFSIDKSEPGVESVYIVDPESGTFLEFDFYVDGALNDRWTYEAMGFVKDDNTRL